MVQPEPIPFIVQRHEEIFKLAGSHEFEPRVGSAAQHFDEVGVERFQNRYILQNAQGFHRQVSEHLLGEIIRHLQHATGEARNQQSPVRFAVEPQLAQLQRDRPPFRGFDHHVELRIRQSRQELASFLAIETQFLRDDFQQLSAAAQFGHADRRALAPREQQVQGMRDGGDQRRQHLLHAISGQSVQVIDDQRDGPTFLQQDAHHRGDQRLHWRIAEALLRLGGQMSQRDAALPQREDDIRQELRRIRVGTGDVQPGDPVTRLELAQAPLRQQRRLAIPRRRRDDGQLRIAGHLQFIQQMLAAQQIDAVRRRREANGGKTIEDHRLAQKLSGRRLVMRGF